MSCVTLAAKLLITLAWQLGCWLPSVLMVVCEVELRASSGHRCVLSCMVFLWLVCTALSAAFYADLLGRVGEGERPDEPEREPGLEFLPPACAALVREARSIRVDIAATKLALERAWLLTQALERASPDVRALVQRCSASLDGVHALLELSSRGRRAISLERLAERLDAELAAFERALSDPRASYR